MKTIELKLSKNQNSTIVFVDKIFEIRYKTPYTSEIISINGSRVEVNGTVEKKKKNIDKLFS